MCVSFSLYVEIINPEPRAKCAPSRAPTESKYDDKRRKRNSLDVKVDDSMIDDGKTYFEPDEEEYTKRERKALAKLIGNQGERK